MSPPTEAQLEAAIVRACELDVHALKPGNVGVHAGGHGMHAEDFLRSARAAAPPLARAGARVGERILAAVQASVGAVGCNTNLGIVLLLAPLASAAQRDDGGLRERLRRVLADLDRDDARACFEAIRIAAPAGLGRAERHDVAEREPHVTLLEAMAAAQDRDRVARQYPTVFEDIFEQGVPWLRRCRRRWRDEAWAVTGCYLRIAASWPDTHVLRKHGAVRAAAVRERMRDVEKAFKACENPQSAVPVLLRLDTELKGGGINPGTSADLTVASQLVAHLDDLFSDEPGDPDAAAVGIDKQGCE